MFRSCRLATLSLYLSGLTHTPSKQLRSKIDILGDVEMGIPVIASTCK